jgi:UTP-glucose-1-phosphate uridylyltransferase
MEMHAGTLRNLILSNAELTAAVDSARKDAADAHFEEAFELLNEVSERRQREIFEALDENSTRDASEANVSQVDIGITQDAGWSAQPSCASNWNPERTVGATSSNQH